MSLPSRVFAPPANHDLAATVSALLSSPDHAAPDRLPGTVRTRPPVHRPRPPGHGPRRRLGVPSGLGTSGVRVGAPVARDTSAGTSTGDSPGTGTSAGAAPVPELYCPPPLRDDPALGEHVNERLVDWAGQVGIYPGQLDRVREANFGRLLMLAHPDCDDPERLLAGAKCALAEWAVDDHYVDGDAVQDGTGGGKAAEQGDPARLGQRLAIAYAAIDPAHLPVGYAPQLEEALQDDPVMVALRSSLDNLSRYATAGQVARLRHELSVMFVAYSQEGVWRATGHTPPVWEYLLHRHENSFLPCMVLIDPLGGYELPPGEFAEPAVRRAFTLAGSASVILNDLYSMTKEDPTDTNLPRVIAAEEGCPLPEAVTRSADIHDELVHTFEAEAARLCLAGSPALRRFLAGVWAWLGGSREWHRTTGRYQQPA